MKTILSKFFTIIMAAALVTGCGLIPAPSTPRVVTPTSVPVSTEATLAPTNAATTSEPTLPAPGETVTATATQKPAPMIESKLLVIKPDGSTVEFTVKELKALPQDQFKAESKFYTGTKVLEVIKAAGITDFNQATVTGGKTSMTFTKAQLAGSIILDYTKQGIIRLVGVNIPKENWVKAVTEIKVE